MSEWRKYKIGDLVETNNKGINKNYPFKNIKYLDTSSITGGFIDKLQEFSIYEAPSRAKRLVEDEDIIYSTVRPIQRHYGIIKNQPENLVVSTGFAVISCDKENLNPLFLYYYLSLDKIVDKLDSIAEGSTSAYPSIRPSDIENLDIELPPLPEQKAIASVLSSLDDKIDLLQRQNQTLEAMAETLFRQWFVEEAEEEWEEGYVPDEFDFVMGSSPPGKSYNEKGVGIPMFQGNADFQFRFPDNRIYTTEPKRFAEKYDTLISVRAPVGEQNMAKQRCCIGRGVAAFKYKYDKTYYTYTYFKLKSIMNEIRQYNEKGTVFGSISKTDFQNLQINLPPQSLIDKFQKFAKPIDDKIIENSKQIDTLGKIRDTLLPKLMSGKVKILNKSYVH